MEEILKLAASFCGMEETDELLSSICQAAYEYLEGRLRDDVSVGSCGKAFPIAVAALASGVWENGQGSGDVTAFSAGSVSLSMSAGNGSDRFLSAAMGLLEPWLKDEGFAFVGV